MRPTSETISRTIAANLLTNQLPAITDDHEKKQVALTALLLMLVAETFDGTAANLIEENQSLRRLFSSALPVIKDNHLKDRVKEAGRSTDENFRISALDKTNCDLLTLFVELHTYIETLEGPDARKIEEAIWLEIDNYKNHRKFMTSDIASSLMASGI